MIIKDEAGLQDQIIDRLKTVFDPELPVNIYELGLVYELITHPDGTVKIIMTLTAPGCPVADQILQDVERRLSDIQGVKEVRVEITFDPPWDRSMMSEEAQLELGFM